MPLPRDLIERPAETRELRFTVIGVPIPQGSTKSFVVRRKRDGKLAAVTTGDNPQTKGWRQTIAEAAGRALLREHNVGIYFTGAIRFDCVFYLPRPGKYLTVKYAARAVPHLTRPDLSKLLRAAEDALSAVVWGDDSQIVSLRGEKKYCAWGESPRAEIAVRGVLARVADIDTALLKLARGEDI
jgi:Holliday junction resolvase RusA-like endonuclease